MFVRHTSTIDEMKASGMVDVARASARAIASDARVVALLREVRSGYDQFKRAVVKQEGYGRVKARVPRWIARVAGVSEDDAACATVAFAPFALALALRVFFAFVRWLSKRDIEDVSDDVFGGAKRRQKAKAKTVEVMRTLPNAAPEKAAASLAPALGKAVARVESEDDSAVLITAEENAAMDTLRIKLDECAKADPTLLGTPALRAFVDDACLCRYLRARKWKVDKALKMLVETLKWRATMRPESLTWNDVSNEARTGKQYRSGRCKRDRRVLVMRPDRENTFNHEENIKFLVYMLENVLWTSRKDRRPRGSTVDLAPEQIVILIDFTKWSRKVAVPLATARETLAILQNHYPERLGIAVCFNPPTIFRVFWSIIAPFIDPKTYTKIIFVNPKKKEQASALMAAIFRVNAVDADMGGQVDPAWNFEDYSKHMLDYDEKCRAIRATWT